LPEPLARGTSSAVQFLLHYALVFSSSLHMNDDRGVAHTDSMRFAAAGGQQPASRGGSARPVMVAFQYDFNSEQLGMFVYMLDFIDAGAAAKCVLAMGSPDLTPETRREALEFATRHPTVLASMNEAPERMEVEWCEDLQLVALQAMQRRQLGWLPDFRRVFGAAAAAVAIRSWHDFGQRFRVSERLQQLADPDIFQFITSGDVQFIWTPGWLATERYMPRAHDATFAARRFRTTPWRKNPGDPELFKPVIMPDEPVGLVIRAKDIKLTLILSQMGRQCLENQTPSRERTILPATAGFIGNMIHLLMGNIFEQALEWEHGVQFQFLAAQNTVAAFIGGNTVHS